MLSFNIVQGLYGTEELLVSFTGKTKTIETDDGPLVLPDDLRYQITEYYRDKNFYSTLYEQINSYMSFLDLKTQERLFNLFKSVRDIQYSDAYADRVYSMQFESLIKEATQIVAYEPFKQWMAGLESNMIIPDNILETYVSDTDMTTTKEKTYVRSEYRDLVSIVTYLRIISPVFIGYYNYFKSSVSFPHYKLYNLLVYTTIFDTEEIVKLKEYIDANYKTLLGATKTEQLIIGAGLSDDDIIDSLTAEVIFNKLISIDFFYKKCNVISYIFQTVKHKGAFATPEGNNIRGKGSKSETSKEDVSYFEDYRKTSDVPIGSIIEVQHALSDTDALVRQLGYSGFNKEAYNKELETLPVFLDTRLDKIQIYMLGWFLSKVINPRSLFYIEYRKVIELALLAKVILIQEGHPFIGLLLGSYKSNEGNYINVLMRHSLSKSLIANLRAHYSFFMDDEKQSIIEKTILETSTEIVNNTWKPVYLGEADKSYLTDEGFLNIPSSLSDIICDYVVFVNKPINLN